LIWVPVGLIVLGHLMLKLYRARRPEGT
jgi:hypothetical protein